MNDRELLERCYAALGELDTSMLPAEARAGLAIQRNEIDRLKQQLRTEGDRIAELNAKLGEQQSVAEEWWHVIHDTLRNYSMTTLVDEEGYGYPLIDAMTADSQTVSGGIEECTYLADAIWNAMIAAARQDGGKV